MKSNNDRIAPRLAGVFVSLLMLVLIPAQPAGAAFDVAVSPPRFELQARPGAVVRETLSVTNWSPEPGRYQVKTADWRLDDDGGLQYHEGVPAPDSCRPWVRLERHTISVGSQGSRTYRFEIHVPPDAAPGECRFALLISSDAATLTPRNHVQIPIVGRLGVIVYVTIGDAKPQLKLTRLGLAKINDRNTPTVTVRNEGNAHGRVFGSLEAKDAKGRKVELVADQGTILPGSSKAVALHPMDWSSGQATAASFDVVPPLHVRGKLQFLGGGEVSIDQIVR